MKRKNYLIQCSDGSTHVAHAWNSANRKVESIVRGIARHEQTIYELTASESKKGADGLHVKGSRSWVGRNGKTLVFTITAPVAHN